MQLKTKWILSIDWRCEVETWGSSGGGKKVFSSCTETFDQCKKCVSDDSYQYPWLSWVQNDHCYGLLREPTNRRPLSIDRFNRYLCSRTTAGKFMVCLYNIEHYLYNYGKKLHTLICVKYWIYVLEETTTAVPTTTPVPGKYSLVCVDKIVL